MLKTWVLVLVINGVTTDLGPKVNINDCTEAWKVYIKQNPKLKYNTFCEWRNE